MRGGTHTTQDFESLLVYLRYSFLVGALRPPACDRPLDGCTDSGGLKPKCPGRREPADKNEIGVREMNYNRDRLFGPPPRPANTGQVRR
jgi:hypothetical protein